jgi:Carboxypeptidase regulatory-like domain
MEERRQRDYRSYWNRLFLVVTCVSAICMSPTLKAQTGGEGAIQGTVTDSSGAVLKNATVTATNMATGITLTRTTSGDGVYLSILSFLVLTL